MKFDLVAIDLVRVDLMKGKPPFLTVKTTKQLPTHAILLCIYWWYWIHLKTVKWVFSLTVQAEDYDTCIADPQREERLRRMEEQMRLIRGFREEGQTLRGEGPVSSSLGQRQLRDSTADFQKQLADRNHVAGSVLTRPFWSGVHHLVSSRKPFCTTWFE